MESNRELSLIETNNVVSLDEQRKSRQQREAEVSRETESDSSAEPQCEGGVCTLAWRPSKKSAAA